MRVLICGNIIWKEAKPIFDIMHALVEEHGNDVVFISGMAPGADAIAYYLTYPLGVKCDEYPYNDVGREKIKRIMGEDYDEGSRNQWMLDSGVDMCFAFAKDIRPTSGTRDMVNRCIKRGGIPVYWSNGEKLRQLKSKVHDRTRIDALDEMLQVPLDTA